MTTPVSWAKQVDGVWQVDLDAIVCPDATDVVYGQVANDSFPFVSTRPGTDEHAWPPGEIEGAVRCLTNVDRFHTEPVVNEYRVPGAGLESGDWPLPSTDTVGHQWLEMNMAGAEVIVIDYAEGDDVVVHSWWGSDDPLASFTEAEAAAAEPQQPPTRYFRNGTIECVLQVEPDGSNAERSCTPHP